VGMAKPVMDLPLANAAPPQVAVDPLQRTALQVMGVSRDLGFVLKLALV